MPLPNIRKQCTAKAKSTGHRCNNPATSFSNLGVCRLHGGAVRRIVAGEEHHWYKHGHRTRSGDLTRKEIRRRLMLYEEIGHTLGFMKGKRTPGRKPQ
jgi:hypothetical protein